MKIQTLSHVTFAFLTLSLLIAPFAHADGTLSLGLQNNNSVYMDANHTGSQITGSITPSELNSSIHLSNTNGNDWQGTLSQQIASTSVTDQGNGNFEITISALPSGIYTFHYATDSNGDIEVNGVGPNGHLNSGGFKKNHSDLYFFDQEFSFDVSGGQNGTYSGTAVSGATDTGNAYLNTSGDLDPKVVASNPALFVLLYVFPFSK
jgi:hypothetical protein